MKLNWTKICFHGSGISLISIWTLILLSFSLDVNLLLANFGYGWYFIELTSFHISNYIRIILFGTFILNTYLYSVSNKRFNIIELNTNIQSFMILNL